LKKGVIKNSIPKPVMNILGRPPTIKFIVKIKKVEIVAGDVSIILPYVANNFG
jgi:hypothetical protein